jgi:hypothetical protein
LRPNLPADGERPAEHALDGFDAQERFVDAVDLDFGGEAGQNLVTRSQLA